ncbi:WcaF family extracellular polysaccharide biosynthesis acetyltransferase [Aquirufa sp. ROCK-SH2]
MNKVNLKSFSNKVFDTNLSKLKYLAWLLVSNIFFLTNIPYPIFIKIFLLKLFGAQIGEGLVIKPWVKIKLPWKLKIGDHVWLGENCWIDNISQISIGNNSCISQGALLITGNHDYKSISFELISKEIIIEEGCWVGANSIVSGGVTLKSHSILSIGSSTSKNLEAYTIYRGNPAEIVKKRMIS